MRTTAVAILSTALLALALPLAAASPAVAGSADPPELAKDVITVDDFTFVGAVSLPADNWEYWVGFGYPHGLTHRYVDGQLKFYTVAYSKLAEFELPDELGTTAPFPINRTYTWYGDIWQDSRTHLVEGEDGVWDVVAPFPVEYVDDINGLYWDEADQRLYWTWVNYYQTGVIDTSIGFSTLDSATHTGTGVGSWIIDATRTSRYAWSMTGIPSYFADAFLGGRRLGLGFGSGVGGYADGSIGPALSAIAPIDLALNPDRAVLTPTVLPLMHHYLGETPAQRPAGLEVWAGHNGSEDEVYTVVNDYIRSDRSPYGVWIEGENKHGLLIMATFVYGHERTTILDDPRNSLTQVVVADPTGIGVGDSIWVHTVGQSIQFAYFDSPIVASIDGNVITFRDPIHSLPQVGGEVRTGSWYGAGGPDGSSRHTTGWYIFDPADLAAAAQGEVAPDEVPFSSAEVVEYPGLDYPLHSGHTYANPFVLGVTFDETTGRLYVLTGLESATLNVYQFNDTPVTPPTVDFAALMQQILDMLRAFIAKILALFT
ncbi:MAG: hypothetical protein LBR33_06830 [Propionibacteriaceae bacterium]|jgi:hypothetical protein|nr:hypothetical protein [Propionibacteriaceae bacterium]